MASKKKVAAKPQVWNKGFEVGKRDGFRPAQVKRICGLLADRGVPGLRDLALFSTAVEKTPALMLGCGFQFDTDRANAPSRCRASRRCRSRQSRRPIPRQPKAAGSGVQYSMQFEIARTVAEATGASVDNVNCRRACGSCNHHWRQVWRVRVFNVGRLPIPTLVRIMRWKHQCREANCNCSKARGGKTGYCLPREAKRGQ